MKMAVCKFYQQGNCKHGGERAFISSFFGFTLILIYMPLFPDHCRYEHPGYLTTRNPFGALSGGGGGGGKGGRGRGRGGGGGGGGGGMF